jgi:hypothetical protein
MSRLAGLLENADPFAVTARDLGHRRLTRRLLGPPIDERVPEGRTADGKADEARHRRCNPQPFADLGVVLAAAQDDAADLVAAAAPRHRHYLHAVLAAVESLDLPDVGLDADLLQVLDRAHHQAGPDLAVVGLLVALEPLELRWLGRHQQLEHEQPAALVQVVGQPLQTSRLPLVQRLLALRVVAHQHLAEGRLEHLDVLAELLAVLEVELVLAALLGRASREIALLGRVAQDRGAELLVHEDAGLLLVDAAGQRGLEAVVNHLLGGGDVGRLLRGQRSLPAEHLCLERAAVVERQDVERLIEANGHDRASFSLR